MTISHFGAVVIFAALVSVVFGVINKATPWAQVRYGAFVFLAFLSAALVIGWLMYPFPF